jgi:5'-nucleotidase
MRCLTVVWCLVACGDNRVPGEPDPPPTATVRVLAFNDFHGAVAPSIAGPGAAAFAGQIALLRTPDTIVIASGDLIGASPLESGLFHDEPTIEAMNAINLDAVGVGNHEFDEGVPELLRMQTGGCHPIDGCPSPTTFPGATFPYLAANVTVRATGATLFPPYVIREVAGVKVAIVGMTLENTPAIVLAGQVDELEFHDEVATMNALLPELHEQGAQIVVLALHEGGVQDGGPNECMNLNGRITAIADMMDPSVALIASGHTHRTYVCNRDARLLTSAGDEGNFVTSIELDVDLETLTVLRSNATNIRIDGSHIDAQVADIVAGYDAISRPIASRVIGTITADLTRASTPSRESALGNVVADAFLAAGTADVSVINDSGLRADLAFTPDGEVTFGEAYAAVPFNNTLFAFDLTGADLVAALDLASVGGPLQIGGATYQYDSAAGLGSRVTAADVLVGGVAVVPAQTYRVIAADFLLVRFPTRANEAALGLDLDALDAYFTANSPVAPPALTRITRL